MKRIDEFAKYIDVARSNSLLGTESDMYDSLDTLRKLRNRIHIQNAKKHFEPDESVAFSDERQREAERTLERLIAYMAAHYQRSKNKQHVADFVLPWDSRL